MAEEEIKLVAYTPELQQAVNKVLGLDRGVRYPRGGKRNTLTETVAAGSYEYNGYFKVVETTDESGKAMLKIIDGADPKSNYAGSTDLGYVPVMSIAKQTGQLYLLPEWKVQNDTRVYSFYLRYNIDPGEIRKAVKLASILSDGTIVQRHVTNEILWGNRFFV